MMEDKNAKNQPLWNLEIFALFIKLYTSYSVLSNSFKL
jgi:hypothetical protein